MVATGCSTNEQQPSGEAPDSGAPAVMSVPPAAMPVSIAAPSAAALTLLRPLVDDRIRSHAEEFDADGRWIEESPYSRLYLARLDTLLERRDALGDEALAAAWRIYLGEHSAGEIKCEILARGSRMLPLVRSFGPQLATTWIPELTPRLALDTTFTADVVRSLTSGSTCDFEHE